VSQTSYQVYSYTQEKKHSSTEVRYFSEKGLLEKELVFSGKDSTLDYLSYYHYENDKLKFLESYDDYEKNNPSHEEFLYNSKNQLIQRNVYEDNQLTNQRHYKYDSLKNSITEFYIAKNDTSKLIDIIFMQSEDKRTNLNIDSYTSSGSYSLYDKDTNLIEYKVYYHDTLLFSKSNYKYNSDGLKIQEITFHPRWQRETIYNLSYQFNENKDWIIRTIKDENNVKIQEIYRQHDKSKNCIVYINKNENDKIISETYRKIIYF